MPAKHPLWIAFRNLSMTGQNHYGRAVHKALGKIYVCHIDHEHDRLYAENVAEYLGGRSISTNVIQLAGDGPRHELQQCLDDPDAAVLSFNTTLDHSWLSLESFLRAAERRGVPVVQWILDHPSARW